MCPDDIEWYAIEAGKNVYNITIVEQYATFFAPLRHTVIL